MLEHKSWKRRWAYLLVALLTVVALCQVGCGGGESWEGEYTATVSSSSTCTSAPKSTRSSPEAVIKHTDLASELTITLGGKAVCQFLVKGHDDNVAVLEKVISCQQDIPPAGFVFTSGGMMGQNQQRQISFQILWIPEGTASSPPCKITEQWLLTPKK